MNRKRRWVYSKTKERNIGKETSNGENGYIYIAALGYDNLYKIGRTSNCLQRQNSLRASNPKMVFVFTKRVGNMVKSERVIHRRLKKNRIEREVFSLNDYELKEIIDVLNSYGPTPPK